MVGMEIAMIDERHFRAAVEQTMLPAIARCRHSGTMQPATEDHLGHPLPPLAELGHLHYVCYDVGEFQQLHMPGASTRNHGAVVISHGFSEFAAKYAEMAWYFLLAGFSVCILEHRGHGYSQRDVRDDQVVYIDDWRRYVADFAKFTREVGRGYAQGNPLTLFAHSMGGGIAAAMLERYPNIVDRAVLSSPMIEANMGLPTWLAATVCGALADAGKGKRMAPGQHGFTTAINWKEVRGASVARVTWFKSLRDADTHYQTTAPANEWVRQAARLSPAVLRQDMCERIETPILMFQAGADHWVRNSAQNEFAKHVRRDGGNLRFIRVPGSVHEVFAMPNAVMAPYLQHVLRFLQTDEVVTVLP